MALDTSSKRRSSVGLLQPWQANAPSPSDSPGVIDQADREQIAWTYSGISAGHPVPVPHGMHAVSDLLRLGQGKNDHVTHGGGDQPTVLRVGQGEEDLLTHGGVTPQALAVGHAVHGTLVA